MKTRTRTRIISFVLTLALLLGCIPLSLFAAAAPEEVTGGAVTNEEIAQGKTDALTSNIPAANGILSAEELTALGVNVVGTFSCDGKSQNYFNGNHVPQGSGYNTVRTDASGRKYLSFHEAAAPFVCGKESETYVHFSIGNASSYANVVKNYELVRGTSTVFSFDVRLAETFNSANSFVVLRSYNKVINNKVNNKDDGTAKIDNMDLYPLYLNADGSVNIAAGFTTDGKTYTLADKISKGAAEVTPFTNFAIHVKPETNSFDVYINGVCQTNDIPTRLLSPSNEKLSTYNLVEQTFENSDGTTTTKVVDTVSGRVITNGTAGISSSGVKDYPLGYIRVLPFTSKTYHGEDCLRENDACTDLHHAEECAEDCTAQHAHLDTCVVFCTESHTHTASCTVPCTKASTETSAPFKFVGDQVDVDSMKAYYSDTYLECAEHEYSVGIHTHNEEALTVSSLVSCTNCAAEWNVTLPMDGTGNSLCDLCEVANAQESMPTFHTADEIKNLITATSEITIHDGSTKFSNMSDGTVITPTEENGNTYYKIGPVVKEMYMNVFAGDHTGSSAQTYANSKLKGKSFVIQIDLRLGENFAAAKKGMEVLKVLSYSSNTNTSNNTLEMINSTEVIYLNSDGTISVRDGDNGKVGIQKLSTDKFTSVAIHVKMKDSTNTCGSMDVYIDGNKVKSDLSFLKSSEAATLNVNTTVNGYDIKINGKDDYIFSCARMLHLSGSVGYEDFLHADNFMAYFADEYVDDYTQHDVVSEHKHDYSNKCTTYGSYCEHCGLGNGGYAVLDADNDKLCDICAREQVNTAANGIIAPAELSAILAQTGGSVIKASAITESSPYGFNTAADSAGMLSVGGDAGDRYLVYNAPKNIGTKRYEKETHLTLMADGNSILSNPAQYNSHKGKSFVYSMGVKLGADYAKSLNFMQLVSYNVSKTTDENGNVTAFTTINQPFVKVDANGYLVYRDGATGSNKSVDKNKMSSLKSDTFVTVSVYVRPAEGEYGLYTIYIDGKPVAEDIQFLKQAESESMKWTLADGTASDGAKDFVVGFIRAFTVDSVDGTTDSYIYLKDPKLYYSDTFVECAEHKFSILGHDHDADKNEIVADLACPCGVHEEIRLPVDTLGDGKCDSCGEFILAGGAFVTGRQVILGDLIALKLYAKFNSELFESDNATVTLKAGNKTVEFKVSELSPDKNGVCELEIKLNSTELAANVEMTLTLDGVSGDPYVTSVRDYAETLISETANEYEKEICRAMLNYSATAQKYFAIKNGTSVEDSELANSGLSEADKNLSGVTSATLSDYAMQMSGLAEGVTFTGATLVLDSKISMKVYFTASSDVGVTLNGNAVTPVKDGEEYFVRISDLLPQDLDNVYSISITNGTTVTLNLSVLSAVKALLNAPSASAEFKDLGRALYLYSLASEMYIAKEKSAAEVVIKDGAKGAAALVLDDGGTQAADYAQEYLQKYDKVAATFALNTHHIATLTKDENGYVFDENGKYTFTQTAAQEDREAYWNALLASTDENGDVLKARIELISHSHTHSLPKDGDCYAELLAPRHILQALFGYNSEAIIAAGGFDDTEEYIRVKNEIYIASRGTNASESVVGMLNTLSEFAKDKRKRMDSFMVQYNKLWLNGEGKFSDATVSAADAVKGNLSEGEVDVSHVEDFIDAAMANNALAAFCIHGIVPMSYKDGQNTPNTLHIYDEQADAIFAYVQKYAETGELWSTTYSEAMKYFSQWNTSKTDIRKINNRLIAINLTDEEDDEIFDMRLTVKVSVSDDWTGATLTQGDYTETVEVKGEAGAKYVLVNVLPDGGIATLRAN